MKKIILISLFQVFSFQIATAQNLFNWSHYYSKNLPYFDMGNYVAFAGPEEIIQFDKSTFSYTRIPFPPDVRLVSNHDTVNMPYLKIGPNNSLTVFASYTNGYLYDGTNWIPFNSYLGFNPNDLMFYQNPGGSQFFSDYSKLYKFDGNTLTTYDSSNSPYDPSSSYDIKFTSNDDIIIHSYLGFDVLHNGTWSSFYSAQFTNLGGQGCISSNGYYALVGQNDTTLYMYSIASGNWTTLSLPINLFYSANPPYVQALLIDTSGMVTIGGDHSFFSYDGNQFFDYYGYFTWGTYSNLWVYSFGYNNNMIINFEDKIYLFDKFNGVLTPLNSDPYAVLPGDNIYPSLKDNQGNLWFGAYGWSQNNGLIKYANNTWSTLPLNSYGIHAGIYTIVQDTGNTIVFGYGDLSSNGPVLVTDTNISFLLGPGVNTKVVADIAIDHNHHYWYGGPGAGVSIGIVEHFNGGGNSFLAPGSSNRLVSIAIDSLDDKWASFDSFDGIYKLSGSTWSNFNTQNSPLPNDTVVKIILQPNTNILWFCTSKGFVKYENGIWNVINTSNSQIPNNYAENVYWDSNGTQWFCTQKGGFAALNNNTWNVYTVFNSPLCNGNIESIVVDNDCSVWLSTERGISHAMQNCGNVQGAFINGTVLQSNATPAVNALVRIFKLVNNGNDINQVDNVFTNNLGNFTYFTKDTAETFYFRVDENLISFPGQLPVYSDSGIVVQNGNAFSPVISGSYNITLQMRAANFVPALNVFQGKINSLTERIGSLNLVLVLNSLPIAVTKTDLNGNFRFNNLVQGNYELWVDKLHLINSVAPSIVIDSLSYLYNYQFQLYADHLELLSNRADKGITLSTINVFPNPFTDKLNIKLDKGTSDQLNLKIYNEIGILKFDKDISNSIEIDSKGFEPGIYFLIIRDKANLMTKKYIKL